jgi:hypothetical protein
MKRLQIIALSVSIFAISAFGINQCAILFHKASQTHLNWGQMWHRSITETAHEFDALWNFFFKGNSPNLTPRGVSATTVPQRAPVLTGRTRKEYEALAYAIFRKKTPGTAKQIENEKRAKAAGDNLYE